MNNKLVKAMKEKMKSAGLYLLKDQAQTAQKVLEERLTKLVPLAMEEAHVDCWVNVSREYCEDPVFRSLVSWDMPNAHRLNIILFIQKEGENLRRYAIGGFSELSLAFYESLNQKGKSEWDILGDILKKENPSSIAINKSSVLAIADGLTATMETELTRTLPQVLQSRLCSSENVVVSYMQLVTDFERKLMETIVEVTHDMIDYAFSKEAISVGQTTTTDLEWLIRDMMGQLETDFWFGPDIDLQRQGSSVSRMFHETIEYGDLLHCDIGFKPKFINLHSDVQRLAYVLKENEENPPEGIVKVLKAGNTFQEIVMEAMEEGKTGNRIFLEALEKAKKLGLKPMLYTHPLGTYGHGAGPVFGQYGKQEAIPGRGDFIVRNNTCYALELNCLTSVPEWDGQEVFAYLEDDICFNKEAFFLSGRQTTLLLV